MEVLRREKSVSRICQERDITEPLFRIGWDASFDRVQRVIENQRGRNTGQDATVEEGVPDPGDLQLDVRRYLRWQLGLDPPNRGEITGCTP